MLFRLDKVVDRELTDGARRRETRFQEASIFGGAVVADGDAEDGKGARKQFVRLDTARNRVQALKSTDRKAGTKPERRDDRPKTYNLMSEATAATAKAQRAKARSSKPLWERCMLEASEEATDETYGGVKTAFGRSRWKSLGRSYNPLPKIDTTTSRPTAEATFTREYLSKQWRMTRIEAISGRGVH